ncbi:hypothetical protein [Mesorhizobium marinum]|uniref:Uncharacterized protein n=1 Tax=Mesorhizobium marinum TaxID=3228790 RepID=A0ABV3R064_9HYPH
MKKFLLAAVMVCAAFPAAADREYTITKMSCSAVQSAVNSNGTVILRWRSKSGMPLYGRYVSDRRFCRSGEIISFASVPAADKSCNVKKCVYKIRDR